MKGQMRFDKSGTVSEELDCRPQKTERPLMNDPCYYCLCNSCMDNQIKAWNRRTVNEERKA